MKILLLLVALIAIILPAYVSASSISERGYRLNYRVDEGERRALLNESNTYFAYSVRASNQPQVINDTNHRLDLTPIIKPPFIDDIQNIFNFKMLDTEIVWYALSLVFDTPQATVNFNSLIDFSKKDSYNLTKGVSISHNFVKINTTVLPELNKAARIRLKSLSFTKVRILKDGQECTDCTLLSYTNGDAVFDVMGFSIYQAAEGYYVPAIKISMGVRVLNATFNVTGVKYNNSYPKNVSVKLGNTYTIFNMTGTLSNERKVNQSNTYLNSIINGGCTCSGCTLINSGLTCLVDINVDAKSQGGVVLSDLNITQTIKNVTWRANTNRTMIDLDDYFFDRNRNSMNYTSYGTKHISVLINKSSGIVKLVPQAGWIGTEHVKFRANDSINTTLSNNVTLTVYDDLAPKWSNIATNLTSKSTTGNSIRFNVTWTDDVNLSSAIFSWNDSGTWVNFTTSNIYKKSYNYTIVKTITAAEGKKVSYRFYARDTSGNLNQTPTGSFTVYTLVSKIGLKLVYPTTDPQYVVKNKLFNVTVNVSCNEKDCGVVNVTLDPITSETIAKNLYYPAIALDTNGYLHMVGGYLNLSNNYRTTPYYCNNSAGTWKCEKINNNISTVIPILSIAIDSNNKVHVANGQQYCKKTASTWTCEIVSSITSTRSSIALDKNNKPHIAFSHYYQGREDNMHPYRTLYELGYCNKVSGSWSCASYYGPIYGPMDPSIALSSNNNVYVSMNVYGYYCSASFGQVTNCDSYETISLCNRSNTSTTWTCKGDYVGSIMVSGNDISSLSLSKNNTPAVSASVYSYRTDMDVCKFYPTFFGGYLGCENLPQYSGSPGQLPVYSSVVVDEVGHRHVVYTDEVSCDLKYCTDSGGGWNCGTLVNLQSATQWGYSCKAYTSQYGQGLALREGNLANSTKYSPYLHVIYRNSYTGNLTVLDFPTGLQKTGIIPKSPGSTPFYTIENNPYSVTLNKGQSSIVTWHVNATGYEGTTHTFFAYANKTSAMSYSNRTSDWTVDIINPPKIFLSSPPYGSFLNTTTVNLTYIPIIQNLQTCILYGDFGGTWNKNKTSTGISLGNPVSIKLNVTQGSHKWNAKCNDTNNVVTWATSNSTFYVDVTPPSIILHNPLNNSLLISNPVHFNWTAYDNFDTNLGCFLILNGTSYAYVQTTNGTATVFDAYNMSSFTYLWNVTCFDTTGNRGSSATWKYPRKVILNSTYRTNYSTENLTLNYLVYSGERGIVNWYKNNKSMTVLNMPFEGSLTAQGGTKVRDYSANANNGTVINAIWKPAGGYDSKGAYYFDGSGDYISLNRQIKFTASDKWSISFWAKKDADSATTGEIAGNRSSTSGTISRIFINYDHVYFYNSAGGPSGLVTFNNYDPDTSWHFYTINAYGSYAELYVDGVYKDSQPKTTSMLITAIGQTFSSGYMAGYIDEMMIWNITLKPSQIKMLYQSKYNQTSSAMTTVGDVWQAKVTSNNRLVDGNTITSNSLTIRSGDHFGFNYAKLNSTYGTNFSTENLTANANYNKSVDKIYSWYKNNKPLAALYMPFSTEEQVAKDYSGNANNGTVIGARWNSTGGYYGKGTYYFSGDDYISISPIKFTSSDKWSLSFWAKKDADSSTTGEIAGNRSSTSGTISRIFINYDHVYFYNSAGPSGLITFNNYDPDISWHFYTINAYGTYAELYVDGVYKDGQPKATSMLITAIGQTFSGGYMIGSIDDVAIWNTTLTPSQIKLIYQNRYDKMSSGMTAVGDIWQTKITPTDGLSDGLTRTTNNLTIRSGDSLGLNYANLNSTYGTNYTTENLTANANYNKSVDKIYSWYKNNKPLAVLYIPFSTEEKPAKDYSGNANNGTVIGARWNSTGGYYGKGAYYFSGDDYISIKQIKFTSSDRWSISFWAKKDTASGTVMMIGNGTSDSFNSIYLSASYIYFYGSTTGGPFANYDPNNAVWHFYTIDAYGSYVELYVDGIFKDSKNYPSTMRINSIGKASSYMTGYIDDVAIWNTTLTDSQIKLIYQNRYDRISSGMTAVGDVWQAKITPTDGLSDGLTRTTNNLTIRSGDSLGFNYAKLNSTYGTNYTTENLTANTNYNRTTNIIYSWYKNNKPLAALYLPFSTEEKPAKDYSGNANNGTVIGARWNSTGGYYGKGAYYFSGDDYISIKQTKFTSSNKWSISFWAKKDTASGTVMIIGNGTSDSLNSIYMSASNLYFYGGTGGGAFANYNSGNAIWHFYTIDAYGSYVELYIDGVFKDSKNYVSSMTINSIGRCSGYMTGYIDDVAIWNTTLTPSQINLIYQNRYDRISSGMTIAGDVWQAKITPTDGLSDGFTKTTNNLTIRAGDGFGFNYANLNSTYGTNYTTENLTANANYSRTTNIIYSWYKNNKPLAALYMPFSTEEKPAKDYSGNANNGTVVGPRWNSTGGYYGKGAYYFSGDDYISINPIKFTASDKWSLSFWAKKDLDSSGTGEIVGNRSSSLTSKNRIMVNYDAVYFYNSAGDTITFINFNPDTDWHFYTIIGYGSYEDLYVDGAFKNGQLKPSSMFINSIGQTYSTGYMTGNIDDLAIWNTTLTPSQIKLIYQNRYDRISSGMTVAGDVWQAKITPTDGLSDGFTKTTNSLTIRAGDGFGFNYTKLNSTSGTNYTSENLTAYAKYSQKVNFTCNWFKNNKSLTALNMPFDMEENPAKDYSGYARDGTMRGGWYNNVGYNSKGAMKFIRGNYVTTPFLNFTANDRWSMSFWAKKTAEDAFGGVVGNSLGSSGSNGVQINYNNVAFYNSAAVTYTFTNYDPDENWHFYTLLAYGTSIDLYVDGAYKDSGAIATTFRMNSIGKIDSGTSHDFDGYVDELIVWNTTLKPSQIKMLYGGYSCRMSSGMTVFNDVWYASITPNDALSDGQTRFTNNLTIKQGDNFGFSYARLNSSYGTNYSTENITVRASYATPVSYYYRYSKNNNPIVVFNMPFNTEDNPLSDYSPKSNDGTAVDARWYPLNGHDSKGAYYFDGTGDYISLGKWINFTANDRWTLNFWFKKTADDTHGDIIGNRANVNDRITVTASNVVFYNSQGDSLTFDNFDPAASTWYFISIVSRGRIAELYVNGKMVDMGYFSGTGSSTIKINTIGIAHTTASNNFGGYIDDISIWNTTLTTTQVNLMYNGRYDMIVSPVYDSGQVWKASVIPTDLLSDGFVRDTNNLTIKTGDHFGFNSAKLNSTFGTNYSLENLTAKFNYSRSPKLTYNWYLNRKPVDILNINFDSEKLPMRDYSTNGNNASTISSTSFNLVYNKTGGHDGRGAYLFGSVNDYVDYLNLTRQISFGQNDKWSTSFWFKKSLDDNHGDIIGDKDNNQNRISILSSTVVFLNNGAETLTFNNFNSAANTWYFATFVANGTGVNMYINGKLNESKSFAAGKYTTMQIDSIGKATTVAATANDFGGYIDELVIWNRTLTAAEVKMIYNGNYNKISSDMLTSGQVWQAEGIPTDYLSDGTLRKTNNITIRLNHVPRLTSIYPNATFKWTTNVATKVQLKLTEPNDQYFNATIEDLDHDSSWAWYINGANNTLYNNKNYSLWIGNYSQQSLIRNITLKLWDRYNSTSFQWNVSFRDTNFRNLNQSANKTAFVSTWYNLSKINRYEVYSSTNPDSGFTFQQYVYNNNKLIEQITSNTVKKFYKIRGISIYGEVLDGKTHGYWKVPLNRKTGSTTKNWVAVPLNDTNIKKAHDLLVNMNATSVSYFNAKTQKAVTCNKFLCPEIGGCTAEACNFNLLPGLMYEVTINSTGTLVYNWTMVGYVRDKVAINLTKKSTSQSRNWIAIKPNSTYTKASQIKDSIGSSLSTISIWDAINQQATGYVRLSQGSGIFLGSNFNTDPSKGHEVWVYQNATWTQS